MNKNERDAANTKEREEQAQIIIDAAVERVLAMGFGVVADGTPYGNGVWIHKLRVERRDRVSANR